MRCADAHDRAVEVSSTACLMSEPILSTRWGFGIGVRTHRAMADERWLLSGMVFGHGALVPAQAIALEHRSRPSREGSSV